MRTRSMYSQKVSAIDSQRARDVLKPRETRLHAVYAVQSSSEIDTAIAQEQMARW